MLSVLKNIITGPIGFVIPEIVNIASPAIRKGDRDRIEVEGVTLKGSRTVLIALALLVLNGGSWFGFWGVPAGWNDWLVGAFAVTVPAKLI